MHLLHIGKTGGTAVKAALTPYADTGAFTIRLHGHPTTLKDVPPDDGVIFFLREPVSRFVSAFYSRLRQGQPRYFYPWSEAEKAIFERFKTANQLALALASENLEERDAAAKSVRSIGHMRGFCARWFDTEEYFLSRLPDMFFIGFQATLDGDFELLKSKLNLPASIQLPTGDVAAHKTPSHFDQSLEPAAVQNLKHWYREDIRFYELCQKIRAENKLSWPPAA